MPDGPAQSRQDQYRQGHLPEDEPKVHPHARRNLKAVELRLQATEPLTARAGLPREIRHQRSPTELTDDHLRLLRHRIRDQRPILTIFGLVLDAVKHRRLHPEQQFEVQLPRVPAQSRKRRV